MSGDTHLEMTCTGAGGEWWMVLDLGHELRTNLEEFAKDNLGEFGYGSEDGPGCDEHGERDVEGCQACFDEYHRHFVDKAEEWAKGMARELAVALPTQHVVSAQLGRERITFRVRECD